MSCSIQSVVLLPLLIAMRAQLALFCQPLGPLLARTRAAVLGQRWHPDRLSDARARGTRAARSLQPKRLARGMRRPAAAPTAQRATRRSPSSHAHRPARRRPIAPDSFPSAPHAARSPPRQPASSPNGQRPARSREEPPLGLTEEATAK
ncbi:hypothetical protein PVAP13_1KG037177 [Panicum virgatum]|uniref:Secreted protein n=1 Tax=Panicum virgatum TaxID=38727 RepID=A0A8T0X6P8_PANVG|nr:hypothetical protein PVAP13_1KG037177 [Panicum virgatum]